MSELERLRPTIDVNSPRTEGYQRGVADAVAALQKIAELGGDTENQVFRLTRFQAAQVARRALSALAPSEGCKWKYDPETTYWSSECGVSYWNEDDPAVIHNGYNFCERCGRLVSSSGEKK